MATSVESDTIYRAEYPIFPDRTKSKEPYHSQGDPEFFAPTKEQDNQTAMVHSGLSSIGYNDQQRQALNGEQLHPGRSFSDSNIITRGPHRNVGIDRSLGTKDLKTNW